MPNHLPLLAPVALALALARGAIAAEPDTEIRTKPPSATPAPTVWEGAIGAIASYRPEYQGAAATRAKITPALFIRYGRLTVTNASGFVTRRADDVSRGVALDLVQGERLRVNAALRVDAGRNESTSADLAGMGNVDATLRVRLTAGYRLDAGWRVGMAWSADALGRGGGNFGDLGLVWEHRLAERTVLSVGASLSAAGDRYMQTYYGVTPEQSARSGYPVYTPSAGLRDVATNFNLRHDIGEDWILLAGAGASRLLGPAADSPITRRRDGWGVNLGLAWRF